MVWDPESTHNAAPAAKIQLSSEREQDMEATFIYADGHGAPMNTSIYRVIEPAAALSAAGHSINLIEGGTMMPVPPHQEEADLIDYSNISETVLIEREVTPDIVRKLRYAGARRIVLTYDDHYGRMPDWAPRKKYWTYPNRYENWVAAHMLVDAVGVAGRQLLNIIKPSAPYVYLPNFLNGEIWKAKQYGRDTPLVLGWGGTKEHKASWDHAPVVEALQQLMTDRRAQNVPVVRVANRVADKFLYEAGVPFQALEWQTQAGWANTVRNFDIGLAPLRGEYDQYRSHLKVLEYAISGVPWVASDQPPYAECEGGILIKSGKREAAQWEAAIRILLDDSKLYLEFVQAGTAWAQHYLLERSVPIYEELLWPTKK